jgi:hypothetical protein
VDLYVYFPTGLHRVDKENFEIFPLPGVESVIPGSADRGLITVLTELLIMPSLKAFGKYMYAKYTF